MPPRRCFALVIPLFVLVLTDDATRTSSCDRTTPSGDTLRCRLRTMAGVQNLRPNSPSSITSLTLTCSEALFFESTISGDFLSRFVSLVDLTIDHCKIKTLPASSFARLNYLETLSVRTHNGDWSSTITELDSDAFLGLGELKTLDLSDNNLRTAPQGVFCPLRGLKTLKLSRNSLRQVGDIGLKYETRSCIAGLEVLDLSTNHIEVLPDESFANLRSLTELNLQRNSINTVGDRSLFGLTSLQVLNLTNNHIVTLPPELFQSTRDIRQIHCKNNSLAVLAPGVFHGLEHLQVLDLSRNDLTSPAVNGDTFSGLVRIVVLSLAHNSLTKIDSVTFRDMYSLQMLNLGHNRISVVTEGAFSGLKNLHALTLSHNFLTVIEAHHFNKLYVLNKLYLDNNKIRHVAVESFDSLSNLQDLVMSDNELQDVPVAIRNLRLLKSLDLGKNNITVVGNTSFQGLDQVYGLRLVDNAITGLTRDSFANLPALHVLNLASNRIANMERGAFGANANLRAVRLDDNLLNDIAGAFGDLKHLGWLNVSSNRIVRFDYGDLPDNLEWLDMHDNHLTKLPQYVNMNRVNLKMLDVSYNRLTEISGGVVPTTIETMYLNNNNITHIEPSTFVDKLNLVKVVLYGNVLRTLDMSALALGALPEGREVPQFYISGNPYMCDCNMEWLHRVNELAHTGRYPRVMDVDSVVCSMTYYRGVSIKPVLELKPSQFLCPYDAHCFALCHCCDFDACDCKMTCPKNCSCYHDLAWTSNVVDCSNAGYEEVPTKIPMDATEIYLDGNDLHELGSHVFIGKKKLQVLYLNNSNLRNVHNRTFRGIESLKVLHLENNDIRELRGDEFDKLHNLNELYLDHNEISFIGNDTFKAMKNLEVLRLDDNNIVNFSPWQLLASSSGSLAQLSFEGNKWSCDCRYVVELESWLKNNPADPEKMYCTYSNQRETVASVLKRCNADGRYRGESKGVFFTPIFISQNYISIFAGVFIAIIIVCMFGALAFAFRQDLRLWVHSKYGVRLFKDNTTTNIAELDTNRLYDAYLIYSVNDEEFVSSAIASELEQFGYSVCLHYRDVHAMSGNSYLSESIASTTESSKRLVIVLTVNFLAFEWTNHDMRTSILSTLKSVRLASKGNKIIFILTTEVGAINLDPELQAHLRSHGAFYWGEKRFWDKFRFAMPDVTQDKLPVTKLENGPTIRSSPNLRYAAPPTLNNQHQLQQQHHLTLPGMNRGQQLQQSEPSSHTRRDPSRNNFATCGNQRGRTYFV